MSFAKLSDEGPEGLGPLIDEFRPGVIPEGSQSRTAEMFQVLTGSACLLLVVSVVIWGWKGLGGGLVLAGFTLLVGLPVCLLVHLLRRRRTHGLVVRAFTGGLVRTRNDKSDIFRWDDVVELSFPPNEEVGLALLQVRARDGRTLIIDEPLPRLDVLQLLIESETFARLWPNVLERFLAGERVVFGPLRADKRGLTVEGYGFDVLPWHHVDRIDLEGGGQVIHVRQEGAFLNWFRGSIPNQHLFLALMDHVRHHGPPT
jgi:hypothetical protein